jgi:hypothetical protein
VKFGVYTFRVHNIPAPSGLVGSFKCKSFGSHLEFQDGDLHLHKIIPLRK